MRAGRAISGRARGMLRRIGRRVGRRREPAAGTVPASTVRAVTLGQLGPRGRSAARGDGRTRRGRLRRRGQLMRRFVRRGAALRPASSSGRFGVANGLAVVHDAPVTETRRTLVDLLDGAEARYGDRAALSVRRDDGSMDAWSYRELARRSRLAAWRLRSRGLRPGDRLLTWSTSCPELAAVYFGAMRAGLIIVPLDLRMAPATVRRIADRSGASQLAIGTGRDAPDPAEADLDKLPTATIDDLCAEPGAGFPADWDAERCRLAPPGSRGSVPAGLHLRHDRHSPRAWCWPTRTRSRASTGSIASSRTWTTASCPSSRWPISSSRRSGST